MFYDSNRNSLNHYLHTFIGAYAICIHFLVVAANANASLSTYVEDVKRHPVDRYSVNIIKLSGPLGLSSYVLVEFLNSCALQKTHTKKKTNKKNKKNNKKKTTKNNNNKKTKNKSTTTKNNNKKTNNKKKKKNNNKRTKMTAPPPPPKKKQKKTNKKTTTTTKQKNKQTTKT